MKRKLFVLLFLVFLSYCGDQAAFMDDGSSKLIFSKVGVEKAVEIAETKTSELKFGDKKESNSGSNGNSSISLLNPSNFSSVQNGDSVTLSWKKDEKLKDFSYEVSKDGGKTWVSAGKASTYTFKKLKVKDRYEFRVRLKDSKGNHSEASNVALTIEDQVVDISLGIEHTFVKKASGKFFVFGGNREGQLGLGDKIDRTSPVELTNPDIKGKVDKFEAAGERSLITTTDGKLFVFGANSYSQLGLGDNNQKSSPTQLVNNSLTGKVKEFSLSSYHAFIETTDNKLFVFGANFNGQLGLGDTTDRTTPVELTDSNISGKVKSIRLSQLSTFIQTTDNNLFVFGSNSRNELGLAGVSRKMSPTELTDPRIKGKVKRVTTGFAHSFIETTDNKLFVFGFNAYGQLGLGDTTNRATPVELTDPNIKGKVKFIALSSANSLIQTTDDKLFVFGGNFNGQLGLGDTTDRTTPVELTNPKIKGKVKRIFSGLLSSSFFIQTIDGKIFVFGGNSKGQLGLGDTTNRKVPTEFILP